MHWRQRQADEWLLRKQIIEGNVLRLSIHLRISIANRNRRNNLKSTDYNKKGGKKGEKRKRSSKAFLYLSITLNSTATQKKILRLECKHIVV